MSFLRVPPAEAAEYLLFVLGWPSGRAELFAGGIRRPWQVGHGERLWEVARRRDQDRDAETHLGLAGDRSACLWAWVSSPAGLRWAQGFRPVPGCVLRFGGSSGRLCLWPLREVVPYVSVVSANERLAYALHGSRALAAPEKLRVPLPGTFLREGRQRPVPVVLTRMCLTEYSREQVVGRLREPPSRDAWRGVTN